MKNIQNYVETVLQPKLQGDGGWIEFVSFRGMSLLLFSEANAPNALFLKDVLHGLKNR